MVFGYFYKGLYEIYEKNTRTEGISNSEKFIQIVLSVISFTHHVWLLWYIDMKISNFQDFQDFWVTLSLTSGDVLFSKLNFLRYFWVFSALIVNLYFCLIIIALVLIYSKKKVPKIMKILTRWIGFVNSTIFFIPIISMHTLALKYSSASYTRIIEFPGNLDSSQLNFGLVGCIFSILSLIFHILNNCVHEIGSYETAHFSQQADLGCKSTCEYDILSNILTYISCIVFIVLGEKNYTWYLILSALVYGFEFCKYLYYLPYYSSFMNKLKILKTGQLMILTFYFLLSKILNNASVTVLLFLFTSVPFIPLILSIYNYRVSFISSSKHLRNSFFPYELTIRPHLSSGTNPDLVTQMNEAFKLIPEKSFLVVQAYYCKDYLNLPMLGLLKISRTNHEGLNIIENFQVYKCKAILQKIAKKDSESFKLFVFTMNFKKVKNLDLKFCDDMIKISNQILDPKIKLEDLKSIINSTCQLSTNLKKKYFKLLKKFPDNDSLLENYGTLLGEMMNKYEKGKKITEKRSIYSEKTIKQRRKNSFNIQNYSCIIVVSGQPETLGKILSANKNFLNFIGINEESLKDSYLSHFVPHPFDINHDLKLKYFIENSTSHHVFRSSPLFILNFQGFLKECYFNSDCIGYEGEINFLSIIEPIINKFRECSIISAEGKIFSHSQNFPLIFNTREKFLEGKMINEYIEDLDISKIEPNYLFIQENFGLIFKEKNIGSVKFLAVYATNDFYTLRRWKSKGFKLSVIEFEEKQHNTLNQNMVEEKTEGKLNVENELLLNEFESRKKFRSSDSPLFKNNINAKLLLSAIKALKIMKYLLLASVSVIQIVTIVVYNTIMLIYMSQAVAKVGSLDVLILLGDISYSLSRIGLVSRSLWIEYYYRVTFANKPSDLENLADELFALNNQLLDKIDDWSFCQYSKVVLEGDIPYWVYSNAPKVNYGNLHKILEKLESESRSFLFKLNSPNQDLNSELFFIINNAIGQTFEVTLKSIEEMKNCNIEQVLSLNLTRIKLMIVAISISGLLGTVLTVYIVCADKILNKVWNGFRLRVTSSLNDYKKIVYDRIIGVHDQNPNYEDTSEKSSKKLKFRHSVRYFLRFLVIFLLAAFVYVVSSYVFYDKIKSFLYNRPIFLAVAMQRRILINNFGFLVCEMKLFNTDQGLKSLYPEFSIQNYPKTEFDQMYSEFLNLRKTLQSNDITNLMTEDLKSMVFESISNVSTFASIGTNAAINYILQESFSLLSEDVSEKDNVIKYLSEIRELCNTLQDILIKCNNGSMSLVNSQLANFTFFLVSFNLIIILSYIIYYRWYINQEILTLSNLGKIMEFYPEKTVFSHSSSK